MASPVGDPTDTHWPRIGVILFAGVAVALHIGKVPTAIPVVSSELHLDLVTVGWLLSLLATIGAIAGSLVGSLVDHLGHRRSLLAGLACATLGSLVGSQAGDGALLLASRALEGAGSVLTVVAAPVLVWRETRPADQRLAFGLWGAWMPAGAATMIALSPLLLSRFGWRVSWQSASALSLVALVLAWGVLAKDPATPRRLARGGLGPVLRRPVSWTLAANFCFYTMSFMTVFGFLPTFLVKQQHFTPDAAAYLTAVGIAGNAVGNILAGWLTRYGLARWQLVIIGCVAMGLAPWGIFADGMPLAGRYGLCLAFAILGGFIPASILSAPPVFAPTPAHVPALGGMLVQGMSIGQLIGPPLLAFLVQSHGSWSVAPVYLTATGAIGACLALVFRRAERRAG